MLYTLFSHDFWVIKCSKKLSKQEKNLDIGYLINCEINAREGRNIHSIRNIHILHEFRSDTSNFSITLAYLQLISQVVHHAPAGVQIFHIYDLFETLLQISDITEEKIILAQLKLTEIFWWLSQEHSNPVVEKICKYIHQNQPKKVLLLTGLSEEIMRELKILVK